MGRLLSAGLLACGLAAGPLKAAIRVDGSFTDWRASAGLPVEVDAEGDTAGEGLDFVEIRAHLAPRGLALYLRTAGPFRLATSRLRVALDTDHNAATGRPLFGLGVDLELDFSPTTDDLRFYPAQGVLGDGTIVPIGEVVTDILPNGVNNVSTHPESAEVEWLIPLSALPGLRPGETMAVRFYDPAGGDACPDLDRPALSVGVPGQMGPDPLFQDLAARGPEDIRVASFNVYFEGPWRNNSRVLPPGEGEKFQRLLAATRPDIILFQELWGTGPETVRQFLEETLPPVREGDQWHVVKNNYGSQDCVTASRYPVLHMWAHPDRFTVALLDTREPWGFTSLVVNAHTKAHVENQGQRIRETDAFLQLVRGILNGEDPHSPGGEVALFIVGDLNANAPKPELTAARTGQFNRAGLRHLNFSPDRFGLPLADAAPRHMGDRALLTWKSITLDYGQRLDYIFYPESRVTRKRAFALDTTTLPLDYRQANGVTLADSNASDHLLLIADFQKRRISHAWEAVDPGTDLDWFDSRWLGPTWIQGDGVYHNGRHGLLNVEEGAGGLLFYDSVMGWWFSNSTLYPFAYHFTDGDWLYFSAVPEANVLWVYRYKTGDWIKAGG